MPALRAAETGLVVLTILLSTFALSRLGDGINRILWLACYCFYILFFLLHRAAVLRFLRQDSLALLWPGLALLSVLWSSAPGATLLSGCELTMSVLIGLYIGTRYRLDQILNLTAFSLVAAGLVSVLFIAAFERDGLSSPGTVHGIFLHKNMLGARMALLFLCGVLILQRPGRRIWGLIAASLGGFLVLLSRSTTSGMAVLDILATAAAVFCLCTEHQMRALLLMVGSVILGIGLAAILATGTDPVSLVFALSGKSETLTGRTDLWSLALEYWREAIWIGHGYGAFWSDDSALGPASFVRMIAKVNIAPTFHNTYLDILVDLGVVGILALISVLLAMLWRAFNAARATRAPGRSLPLAVLGFALFYSFVERSLFGQHEYTQILLVMCFASAGQALEAARRDRWQAGLKGVALSGAHLRQILTPPPVNGLMRRNHA